MIPNLDHLPPAEGDAYLQVLEDEHLAREARKRAENEANYAAEDARITALNLDGKPEPAPEHVESPIVEPAEQPEEPQPVETDYAFIDIDDDLPGKPMRPDGARDKRARVAVREILDLRLSDDDLATAPEPIDDVPAAPVQHQEALDPYFAPGCFGSSLTYKYGSPECSPCPFAPQCAPLSAKRHAYVRGKHGLDGATPDPSLSSWHIAACRRAGDVVSQDVGRKTQNTSERRAKLKAANPEPEKTVKPPLLATFKLTIREERDRRKALLQAWLGVDGRRQRKLRPRSTEILWCWVIFHCLRQDHGRDPTPSEFGRELMARHSKFAFKNVTSAGQMRINLLRRLEEPGGPWAPATSDIRQDEAPATSDIRQDEAQSCSICFVASTVPATSHIGQNGPGISNLLSALTAPEE